MQEEEEICKNKKARNENKLLEKQIKEKGNKMRLDDRVK